MKRPRVLSVADVETHASDLLAEYSRRTGKPVRLPVPIELIIEHALDLDIAWEPLLERDGHDIASKIEEPSYGTPCRIVMNDDYVTTEFQEHPGLIETALAHEAGHGHLHIDHGQIYQMALAFPDTCAFSTRAESLTSGLSEALRRRGPVGDVWWREWQAHTFMRFVLMPRALLLPAMEETGYHTWDQLYDLRARCTVTISALVVHMEKLRFIRVEGRRIYDIAAQPSRQPVLGN